MCSCTYGKSSGVGCCSFLSRHGSTDLYTISHLWSASTYWNFLRGSPGGPVEWVTNKWCLDKLSSISNDISTLLLHDLGRTMRLIAIKKLIKVCVSLLISWADTCWQTHRFPCNQVYWPEHLETAFITAALWCVLSEQPTDTFVSHQTCSHVFLLLSISLCTMVSVN